MCFHVKPSQTVTEGDRQRPPMVPPRCNSHVHGYAAARLARLLAVAKLFLVEWCGDWVYMRVTLVFIWGDIGVSWDYDVDVLQNHRDHSPDSHFWFLIIPLKLVDVTCTTRDTCFGQNVDLQQQPMVYLKQKVRPKILAGVHWYPMFDP